MSQQDTTSTTTLDQFIVDHELTMSYGFAESNPNMDDSQGMDHWRVNIRSLQRSTTMDVVFSKGSAHNGEPPTLAEVLDCLASDASSFAGADFEDWCAELGFDTDSRRAERIYKATERQSDDLLELLGNEAYADLL